MSGTILCGCDPDYHGEGSWGSQGWVCERHRSKTEEGPMYTEDLILTGQNPLSTSSYEIRVTDPSTGGQKGTKLQRFSLIPSEFLWALAEHYGIGAKKYADRNWEKGYTWSLCIDALDRHWHQWRMGESHDPETGSHHLIAVAWHACALFIFELRKIGTDDRFLGKDKPSGSAF